jgi:hypothetical protein
MMIEISLTFLLYTVVHLLVKNLTLSFEFYQLKFLQLTFNFCNLITIL